MLNASISETHILSSPFITGSFRVLLAVEALAALSPSSPVCLDNQF